MCTPRWLASCASGRLDENLAVIDIRLTAEKRAQIDAIFPLGGAVGGRYAEHAMKAIDR